jgi:hypothetical protein
MKQTLNIALILLIFLTACSAVATTPLAPTETPHLFEPTFTETLTPAPGEIPTETPTATSSVPMIEVDGLQIPEPKVSNPELFDLTEHLLAENNSPIVQFANAFGVNPEEVGDLTPQLLTGIDGKQFVVLTTGDLSATANFDESGTPLLIAEQGENGEWEWKETPGRIFADDINVPLGTQIVNYKLTDKKYTQEIVNFANLATIAGEFDWGVIARGINIAELIRRIKNGENPKNLFDFSSADKVVLFANENGMRIIIYHVFTPQFIPNELYEELRTGNISWDDFELFLKVYAIELGTRYNGTSDPLLKINEFVVANEIAAHLLWSDNNDIINQMVQRGTLTKLFKWLNEVNPNQNSS